MALAVVRVYQSIQQGEHVSALCGLSSSRVVLHVRTTGASELLPARSAISAHQIAYVNWQTLFFGCECWAKWRELAKGTLQPSLSAVPARRLVLVLFAVQPLCFSRNRSQSTTDTLLIHTGR
jgi:hypothetical protein